MPYRAMRTNEEYARLRRDVAYAMRRMAKDIRVSTYNEDPNNYGSDKLVLPVNSVSEGEIEYTATDGVLTRAVDGGAEEEIIREGLRLFSSNFTNSTEGLSGVVLRMEIENNSDGDIAIEHETFIATRNDP